MGEATTKIHDAKRAKGDLADDAARRKVVSEAKRFGATLDKPDAKGGLPGQLVLDALRRDRYRCKRCGSRKGIGPHHKSGVVDSTWADKKGHANELNNIATLCAKCHDKVHQQARDLGVDSSQVLAKGDAGDPKRDHGQPRVTKRQLRLASQRSQ